MSQKRDMGHPDVCLGERTADSFASLRNDNQKGKGEGCEGCEGSGRGEAAAEARA